MDVIQARLQLAEVLDQLLMAGEYQLVGEAIKRVRQDLQVLSTAARRMAAQNGETIPPIRPPRRDPKSEERIAQAIAQFEAALGITAERELRENAGENVSFMADQLDRRKERRLRRPHPPLMV